MYRYNFCSFEGYHTVLSFLSSLDNKEYIDGRYSIKIASKDKLNKIEVFVDDRLIVDGLSLLPKYYPILRQYINFMQLVEDAAIKYKRQQEDVDWAYIKEDQDKELDLLEKETQELSNFYDSLK